jgi:hypothetical protein
MTQVGAELFCAHAAGQAGSRMPKHMLLRFIARANREGIPLSPRTEGFGLGGRALAVSFVFALLLMSVTFRFGSRTRAADEAMRGDTGGMTTFMRDGREAPSGSPTKSAPADAQASLTARRQKARGKVREAPLLAIQTNAHRSVSRVDSGELAVDSQTFETLHLPFLVTSKLSQVIQWAPARYGTPRFSFIEPSKLAEDDPPRLVAGYEPRFLLWTNRDNFLVEPGDVPVLRREFDPDTYKTLLSPDCKRNVPAFRFSESAQQ